MITRAFVEKAMLKACMGDVFVWERADREESKRFYINFLIVVEDLLTREVDEEASAVFSFTTEKLRTVVRNPPTVISFAYPLLLGEDEVLGTLNLFIFFHNFKKYFIEREVVIT